MASARKKQDEKHLKILRELVALPSNKECFDCHQRGPTYVNMTIGSFVCTSCSGLLRGLTPPHRVKSISMASFSPEEVDMVKSRGNEYCRRIWLGLFDSNHAQDTKDEQQIKEFMVSKYEKKRYYLEPSITNKNGSVSFSPPGTQNHSRTSTPTPMMSIPESKPLTLSVQQSKPFTLNVNASTATPAANMFTPDKPEFVADFGSDPFASSTQFTSTTMPSFANFDNNPVFSTANSHFFGDMMNTNSGAPARCNTNRWSMPTAAALSTMSSSFSSPARKAVSSMGVAQPPSEDRYAALKDLDCLMKTQQTADSPLTDWSSGTGNSWTVNTSQASAHSVFGSPQSTGFLSSSFQDSQTTVNPFSGVTQSPWTVTAGINGVANSSQSSLFSVNPFQNNKQGQSVFGMANDAWSTNVGAGNYPTSHVANGSLTGYQQTTFPSSQSMNFAAKPWHAVQISNPFVLGASPTPAGHSSNPFL